MPPKKNKRMEVVSDETLPKQPIVKSTQVTLTDYELLHLRDMFSVLVPPAEQTVSQVLAALESRTLIESKLWSKIRAACTAAGIPVEDDAPDYIIAPSAPPPMGVFRLASSPDGAEAPDDDSDETSGTEGSSLFSAKENS